jgi:methionyl aminopeptidase
MVKPKTTEEILAMKTGGRILASILETVTKSIIAGESTKNLANIAKSESKRLGAEPAFYNYGGFPDVICISVNDQVVHGLPGEYIIKTGDVVSIDFGVKYNGLSTDAARTVLVDSKDPAKLRLVETTQQALDIGINVVKAGIRTGDIGCAIQQALESRGLGVVRTLVGHGVGRELHEEPDVPNYGLKNSGVILPVGATIAIEPMATLGSYDVYTTADGWSIATKDGSLSAHFEDTVLVTEDGAEILTRL